MYKPSVDSNNNMTYSMSLTYETQAPQFSLRGSAAVEDDRYFNLLYKSHDSSDHGINNTINHLTNDAGPSTTELQRINEALMHGLFDYRQMDADLARIKQKCEVIEENLARLYALPDKQPKVAEGSNPDFNLIGFSLTSMATENIQELPAGLEMGTNFSPFTLSSDLSLRHAVTDISAGYQALPMMPAADVMPSAMSAQSQSQLQSQSQSQFQSAERETFEQPVRRLLESKSVPTTEPYRCPVCLKCVRQRKPASTMCGHVFCSSCIKTALRATCKCPVCQQLMTTSQIFRIYI